MVLLHRQLAQNRLLPRDGLAGPPHGATGMPNFGPSAVIAAIATVLFPLHSESRFWLTRACEEIVTR